MAISIWTNVILPIIELLIISSVIFVVIFFFIKGWRNAWRRSIKWFIKYRILRKPFPEKKISWILDCIARGIGWYDAKKLMLIKGNSEQEINEVLWLYDLIIAKGGEKNVSRKHTGSNSQAQATTGSAELPSIPAS